MVAGVPAAFYPTCPRCKTYRRFVNVDGGTLFRCGGCEWYWTLSTQAPTGSATAPVTAGVTTAITVASGGASFTSGMLLLYDTLASAEVVTVTGSATGVSVPVPAGFIKSHLTGVAFGKLLISPALSGVGLDAVPNAPGWGF
jgi:hypothetical protein